MDIHASFPRYTEYEPQVPVWCITPGKGGNLHRFFDTSPVSPSGRYVALLRMPQETRLNLPGEQADIVLIDLAAGEERVIATTCGWEPQLGANINWGASDNRLYYNDVEPGEWEPFCVELDPFTGSRRRLEGGIYRISPDGTTIISACMKRMRRTQYGYGVVVPNDRVPRNAGFREDDGLYATDVASGRRKLLVSIQDAMELAKPAINRSVYANKEIYGFHCKFNPQGTRLLFSMRGFTPGADEPWNKVSPIMDFWVLTMRPDGTDIRVAVGPELWYLGGSHINWFPDGDHLSMNLGIDGGRVMKLVRVRYDGTDLRKMTDEVLGSGHPTVHPDGRHVLTDSYENEPVTLRDGTVPLRLIDLKTGTERTLVRINVANPGTGVAIALRVDPHPAWAPDYRHVVFNGYVNGTRRVFIADLGDALLGV
ncbi:TolB-like translocation protein [Paenibacillus cymbidii]|uniref:hypothetical protein n=1 Tax=Paenibacillus cymbidii TaxID=1639034 RepID=UPI0010803F84|nr:hypothetical protein [Paenibacillus cymbidii]